MGEHLVMGAQDAAFARLVHERVLNTLNLVILGVADRAAMVTTVRWMEEPSLGASVPHWDDVQELVAAAVARSGVAGVVMDVPQGLDVRVGERPAAAISDAIVEALRNAARHADATKIQVQLESSDEALHVTIEDDGRGFHEAVIPRFGLSVGICEAMAGIGGRAEVSSVLDRGTRVLLCLSKNVPAGRADAQHIDGRLAEQWPEVADASRRLLAQLIRGEIALFDERTAERARIEDGRLRAWLDCHRMDSWMAREVFRCVSRLADQGRYVPTVMTGRGGIEVPIDADFMALLKDAKTITLTIESEREELSAVVDAITSDLPSWGALLHVERASISDGLALVRVHRGS